ncbi:MAG: hypothetical protein ACREBV_03620, partial [Candidatus Zixiibacteriota bacterium]
MHKIRLISVALVMITLSLVSACIEKIDRTPQTQADTLAAAEPHYEMITYYLVMLRRGPNWTAEITPEVENLQKEHLAHINQMASTGDLVLAGPFLEQSGDSALSGLFIFKVET